MAGFSATEAAHANCISFNVRTNQGAHDEEGSGHHGGIVGDVLGPAQRRSDLHEHGRHRWRAHFLNRPREDLSALSAVGTAVHYATLRFSAGIGGDYTFLTIGNFDTFSILYQGSLLPASPYASAVVANDDLLAMATRQQAGRDPGRR